MTGRDGASSRRAKSPGPNHYRIQSASFLRKNPSATIGNEPREISQDQRSVSRSRLFGQGPGPQDYKPQKPWNGPKYHFAKKYRKSREEASPGPGEYQVNPVKYLR